MKRSEMFEKIQVICPTCPETKNVRPLNKSSYKGDLGTQPYVQQCRACSNKQRTMGEEARRRISEANSGRELSKEDCQRKSDFMKDHPELWVENLRPELGPKSRVGTHHSEKSKAQIAASQKGRKKS